MGTLYGVDVTKINDISDDLAVPKMDFSIRIDCDALAPGYAGVYASFQPIAKARVGEVRHPGLRHSVRTGATRHGRRSSQ